MWWLPHTLKTWGNHSCGLWQRLPLAFLLLDPRPSVYKVCVYFCKCVSGLAISAIGEWTYVHIIFVCLCESVLKIERGVLRRSAMLVNSSFRLHRSSSNCSARKWYRGHLTQSDVCAVGLVMTASQTLEWVYKGRDISGKLLYLKSADFLIKDNQ